MRGVTQQFGTVQLPINIGVNHVPVADDKCAVRAIKFCSEAVKLSTTFE